MVNNLGKIQYYIIPLIMLGFLATCDTDFGFDNSINEEQDSNLVAIPTDEAEDSVSKQPLMTIKDTLKGVSKNQEPLKQSIHSEKMWRVVITSNPNEAKVQKLASRLETSDAEIIFVPELNTYRLVFKSHPSLDLAQNTLAQVQGQFPDAWLIFF